MPGMESDRGQQRGAGGGYRSEQTGRQNGGLQQGGLQYRQRGQQRRQSRQSQQYR
jgi:hypothetical protein